MKRKTVLQQMLNEVFDDYNNAINMLQLQVLFPDKGIEVLKGFLNV